MNKPFDRRWMMVDYARQRVFVREEYLLLLDTLERLHCNGLGVYLEGAMEFPHIPGRLRDGVITPDDAAFMVAEGKKRGVFVFPMTNVVGHMEHFFWQERFRPLMQDDYEMQMSFQKEGAFEFVMEIVRAYAKAFGTGLVHIGGDETRLTPETKLPYAHFLEKVCSTLLDEGIQPAIWDDMIWMDQELVDVIPRKTFIFDWSYYGHRPESPVYFREKGFTDIVVCPCDNAWEGFINYQRASGYLKASKDPVKPEEIEAFYDDARKAGVYGGLQTNWNNHNGANMWAQWSCIARAMLYMNGEIDEGADCDDAVETALFGRVTPYTAVTRILQYEVMRKEEINFEWFMKSRRALTVGTGLADTLKKAMNEQPSFTDSWNVALDKADALLNEWVPATPLEDRCLSAMRGAVEMARAGGEVIRAGSTYPLYAKAAAIQFEAPHAAAGLLAKCIAAYRRAAAETETFRDVFGAGIEGTGHTASDLKLIDQSAAMLRAIADDIRAAQDEMAAIPLPRFDRIIDHAVTGKRMVR